MQVRYNVVKCWSIIRESIWKRGFLAVFGLPRDLRIDKFLVLAKRLFRLFLLPAPFSESDSHSWRRCVPATFQDRLEG